MAGRARSAWPSRSWSRPSSIRCRSSQALLAGSEGAAFGFFPILWIVINAIWIYNLTVATGHFDVLRRSFARVSDDQRIQGVIIAFCFGALLEALAGFGTPVAITSVMLIALGFHPLKAATVALVANTAPGGVRRAGGADHDAGHRDRRCRRTTWPRWSGGRRRCSAVFVPFALVFIIDGRRGVRQTLPAMLVCGVAFAVAQYAVSNFGSTELTDIVASLVSAGAVVLFLRVWHPREVYVEEREREPPPSAARATVGRRSACDRGAGRRARWRRRPRGGGAGRSRRRRRGPAARGGSRLRAVPGHHRRVRDRADHGGQDLPRRAHTHFAWPGLHLQLASGKPSTLPMFKFDWLAAAGTLLVIAGLITIPIIGVRPGAALRAYLAHLQAAGGRDRHRDGRAGTGLRHERQRADRRRSAPGWPASAARSRCISPLLGWLGTAVTGSDTSSNSLFGALQVAAAHKSGVNATLLAGANSSGGVLGKMISPQNLAIAVGGGRHVRPRGRRLPQGVRLERACSSR